MAHLKKIKKGNFKKIYTFFILSKFKYSAFLYVDTKQSTLKVIEAIHNIA